MVSTLCDACVVENFYDPIACADNCTLRTSEEEYVHEFLHVNNPA